MNVQQYQTIVNTKRHPTIVEVIDLLRAKQDEDSTSELIDFCTHKHPHTSKTSQGSTCRVQTHKGIIHYIMFPDCILEHAVSTNHFHIYKR